MVVYVVELVCVEAGKTISITKFQRLCCQCGGICANTLPLILTSKIILAKPTLPGCMWTTRTACGASSRSVRTGATCTPCGVATVAGRGGCVPKAVQLAHSKLKASAHKRCIEESFRREG